MQSGAADAGVISLSLALAEDETPAAPEDARGFIRSWSKRASSAGAANRAGAAQLREFPPRPRRNILKRYGFILPETAK